MIGDKNLNVAGLRNFFNHIRGYPKDMKVVEIGAILYQFFFSDVNVIKKILSGSPYIIDNQLLNIKEWEEDIEHNSKAFDIAHM